jgi:hypothetical protein
VLQIKRPRALQHVKSGYNTESRSAMCCRKQAGHQLLCFKLALQPRPPAAHSCAGVQARKQRPQGARRNRHKSAIAACSHAVCVPLSVEDAEVLDAPQLAYRCL